LFVLRIMKRQTKEVVEWWLNIMATCQTTSTWQAVLLKRCQLKILDKREAEHRMEWEAYLKFWVRKDFGVDGHGVFEANIQAFA
jgi:hypothetical protein